MVRPEIVNYIKAQLLNGVSKETIQNNLIQSGWQINDITDTFNQISNPNNTPTSSVLPISTSQNIQSSKTVAASTDAPKSKIIGLISVLFFTLSFINLRSIILFIVLINTLNQGMIKSFPGALPYSAIKYVPYIGPVGTLFLIPVILYLYLALKVRSGSKEAWKTSLILSILIVVFQLIVGVGLTILTSQVYSKYQM